LILEVQASFTSISDNIGQFQAWSSWYCSKLIELEVGGFGKRVLLKVEHLSTKVELRVFVLGLIILGIT